MLFDVLLLFSKCFLNVIFYCLLMLFWWSCKALCVVLCLNCGIQINLPCMQMKVRYEVKHRNSRDHDSFLIKFSTKQNIAPSAIKHIKSPSCLQTWAGDEWYVFLDDSYLQRLTWEVITPHNTWKSVYNMYTFDKWVTE